MSPAAATLIAACRSPPAGTTCVAAEVAEAEINKTKRIAKVVFLGETLQCAAHSWEIDIVLRSNVYRDV